MCEIKNLVVNNSHMRIINDNEKKNGVYEPKPYSQVPLIH